MRLLHFDDNGSLSLTEFPESARPKYAILSHRWETEEFAFDDLRHGIGWEKVGYKKVQRCGLQARKDGLEYFWVDTCCIDKSSSAELSEAINSMFEWYKQSTVCYVYLSDVGVEAFNETFRASRWFKRGWTLQELIAPRTVRFFDLKWIEVGSRTDLCGVIASITSISENVLQRPDTLLSCSIAQRMSWAAGRETTRLEDMAYSLLGIFEIHMPLLYGERMGAFIRLQEEIIKNSTDDSIFAWGLNTQLFNTTDLPDKVTKELRGMGSSRGLLALSPEDFKNCGTIRCNVHPSSAYTMSNCGLDIQLSCASGSTWDTPGALDGGGEGITKYMGGLGLLRCTGSKGVEIFGILLSPVGDRSRCDRVVCGIQHNATVQVNARVASRAVLQRVTISHGRDREMQQRSTVSCWQPMYIMINMRIRLPVEVLKVNSYHLCYHWEKDHHTWDPESQIITARHWSCPWGGAEAEEIFVIEYGACPPQLSDCNVVAARFFIILWCNRGKALIRETAPFSSSDYDEVAQKQQQRAVQKTDTLSIERFEAMAGSVTLTHRIDQKKLAVVVDVKKRENLNRKFITLDVGLQELVPTVPGGDEPISAGQSHIVD